MARGQVLHRSVERARAAALVKPASTTALKPSAKLTPAQRLRFDEIVGSRTASEWVSSDAAVIESYVMLLDRVLTLAQRIADPNLTDERLDQLTKIEQRMVTKIGKLSLVLGLNYTQRNPVSAEKARNDKRAAEQGSLFPVGLDPSLLTSAHGPSGHS